MRMTRKGYKPEANQLLQELLPGAQAIFEEDYLSCDICHGKSGGLSLVFVVWLGLQY